MVYAIKYSSSFLFRRYQHGKSAIIHSASMSSSTTTALPLPHPESLSGVFAVHKPIGWSSNNVVTKFKGILSHTAKNPPYNTHTATLNKNWLKIGHGGTLDPLAEGVLVIGVGKGTKLLQSYLSGSKAYRATATLGTATDTLDSEGTVTATVDASHVTHDLLSQAMTQFQGPIQQVPPMYSALKKNGKRLYELARKGIEVDREPRNVTVYHLQLLKSNDQNIIIEPPKGFVVDVECSGGFYVRSLIDDVAKQVNTVAHMSALLRTKQGVFTLSDCIPSNVETWNYAALVESFMHCQKKLLADSPSMPQ